MEREDEFLAQKRRNIAHLLEHLAELLQARGFAEAARGLTRRVASLEWGNYPALADSVGEAAVSVLREVYPSTDKRKVFAHDAPHQDILGTLLAVRTALGNLKVYVRYGMRRPDVEPEVLGNPS